MKNGLECVNQVIDKGEELPALIWRFEDAPPEFHEIADCGGDENWIAYFPPGCHEGCHWYTDEGNTFGCCRVYDHELPDGRGMIRVGVHS